MLMFDEIAESEKCLGDLSLPLALATNCTIRSRRPFCVGTAECRMCR